MYKNVVSQCLPFHVASANARTTDDFRYSPFSVSLAASSRRLASFHYTLGASRLRRLKSIKNHYGIKKAINKKREEEKVAAALFAL